MTNPNDKIMVAAVLSKYQVVINRGARDGIEKNELYTLYALSEEYFDPVTGEGLGQIARRKGTGEVVHVQEKLAIVRSAEKDRQGRLKEFVSPEVGDLLRLKQEEWS